MFYTLGEAAKATQKSKSTLSKAIKNGKISATKQSDGTFKIDPSELHRVFPKRNSETVSIEQSDTSMKHDGNTIEVAVLRAKLKAAEQQIDDIKEDRDHWRQQANRLLSAPHNNAQHSNGFFRRLFVR